jgi:hypothetical protein
MAACRFERLFVALNADEPRNVVVKIRGAGHNNIFGANNAK